RLLPARLARARCGFSIPRLWPWPSPPRARVLLTAPALPICGALAGACSCAALPHSTSSCSRGLRPSHYPLRLRHLRVPEIRVAERLAGINQGAAHRVSEVVLRARTMIDAVLATSRRSAFKRHKLSAQSIVIEQCSSP